MMFGRLGSKGSFGSLGGLGVANRSASTVLPVLSRIPISAVTDGGSTTSDSALILASPANRRNAKMVTTAAARDFRITLGAVNGTGGGLVYLDGAMNDTAWNTMAASYSTDGGATFPNALTVTLFAPSGAPGYGSRGQYIALPQLVSGAVLKITYTASAGSAFAIGLVNIDSNPKKNAIFVVTGTSVEQQGWVATATIDQINLAYPTYDSLVFNWGRTGGHVDTIYNEAFSQIATGLPFVGYALVIPWENEVFQIARGITPFIYAGDASTAKADITNGTPSYSTYAAAHSLNLIIGSMTFSNYLLNSPGAGAPAVDQAAASGGPFPAKGNQPYNANEIFTAVQAASADSYDSALGIFRIDAFSRVIASWENFLTSADMVHPATAGIPLHEGNVVDFAGRYLTGSWPMSWVERQIALYEGTNGAPASVVSRITNAINQWPAATTSPQTTARAALTTRLAAVSTSYVDPSLTGAAVLPSSMAAAGTQDWWNFSDFTKLTVGQASPAATLPQSFDLIGMTSAVASRGSSASTLQNTTTSVPAVRPVWVPKGSANGARGILDFNPVIAGAGVVLNAAAATPIIGSLDAGNPELLVGLVWAPASTAKVPIQFTAGASNLRIGMATGVYGLVRVIDTATVIMSDPGSDVTPGTWLVTVFGVSAGSWILDRNGAQVATGSRTLSARTGSAFTIGTGSAGKIQEVVVLTGTGAFANRAALNAYLRQVSGAY